MCSSTELLDDRTHIIAKLGGREVGGIHVDKTQEAGAVSEPCKHYVLRIQDHWFASFFLVRALSAQACIKQSRPKFLSLCFGCIRN